MHAGITVVVAKPGVYVPGIDTTIGVGKIRGINLWHDVFLNGKWNIR